MALADIVTVNITTQATAPTRVGFGTPLVMAYHTNWLERARSYSTVQAMIDDGFDANSLAVKAVTALLSQNPKVGSVIVGRMANAPVPSFKLTPTAQNSTIYNVYVNGQLASFTSDASATVAEITLGLKGVIDALAIPGVTTTDNLTDLDVAATAGVDLWLEVEDRTLISRIDNTPDPGIVADLTAVQNVNDDWYTVHVVNNSSAIIAALAANIETQYKMFVTESADDGILDALSTTDIAYVLSNANYARTALLYHTKPAQYAGAAWAGVILPNDPGSLTWKFKTLAGVSADILTATEITNIEAKNCNHYTEVAGVAITQQGVTAAGEFCDITRFVDWLQRRMQERIYARLVNAPKLPFTDPGISTIGAEVSAQLNDGIAVGGLAADPEPTVILPLAADVPFADKAARRLTGIEFSGTLAGAIHELVINGTVTA